MKKENTWLLIICVVAIVGMSVFAIVDSRNILSHVNESIKEMTTEFNSVSKKYAYVNPKPVTTVELNKSQLRELYRMQVIAREYEAMADQDTLTLEQKVDVLSMVVANYARFTYYRHSNYKFYPEPTWDEWFRDIKEATDSEIDKAIE